MSLCRTCQENPDAASLSIHNRKCPQGYTFAEKDSKCLRTFTSKLTWSEAKEACKNTNEGGHLATTLTLSSIQPVIESMNLQGIEDECWIGGKRKKGSNSFIWTEDNTEVTINNWADRFPNNRSDDSSCMHQTGGDGYVLLNTSMYQVYFWLRKQTQNLCNV